MPVRQAERILCMKFNVLAVIAAACALAGGVQASPHNRVKELPDMRSAESKAWQNDDGSITREIHTIPIHYRDDNGRYQEIDTSFSLPGKSWARASVTKNPLKVHIGKKHTKTVAFATTLASAGSLSQDEIELNSEDGSSLSFVPEISTSSQGITDGNVLTYTDAWPSVDLRYTVMPSSLKEDIVLKEDPGAVSFRFTVNHSGLTVSQNEDGSLVFTNQDGISSFTMPFAYMVDANGNRTNAVAMTMESTSDSSFVLCITPDQQWLAQAAYPVTIDPTVSTSTSSTAYTQVIPGGAGKVAWYSGEGTLYMYSSGAMYGTKKSYLKWTLPSIPTATTVDSATILFNNCSGNGNISIRQLKSDFFGGSGGYLFYPPSVAPTAAVTDIWNSSSFTYSCSAEGIKTLVQSWINGNAANYGIEVRADTTGQTMSFYDHTNGGYAPCLSITYHPTDTTGPTISNLDYGDKYTNDNTQFHATWSAKDPESSVAGYKWALSDTATPPTNESSWTYTDTPSADLTGQSLADKTYYFYVAARNADGYWGDVKKSDGVMVDTTKPTLTTFTASADSSRTITIRYIASDAGGSGVSNVELYDGAGKFICNSGNSADGTFVLHAESKTYTFTARAIDKAGNVSDPVTRTTVVPSSPTKIIYVTPDGNDNNDGKSWGAAKTLEGALLAASSGDEIWGKKGKYQSSSELTMKDGVALYGGFAGNEKFREQRNIAGNETILDGSNAHMIIYIYNCNSPSTRIDGFTIQNGKGIGGIYCLRSLVVTIANNKFLTNIGEAINCDLSAPKIENNKFSDNSSSDAAVIGISRCYSDTVISGNDISFNRVGFNSQGEAIRCQNTDATISNNTISYNTGSGIGVYDDCSPCIYNNIINANTGSGLYFEGNNHPQVINNTIVKNTDGIVACCYAGNVVMANNIVAFNKSGITWDAGGSYTPTADYNCVFGNGTGKDYIGLNKGANDVVNKDPELVDMAGGNLHIPSSSPCVNAGDNSRVGTGWFDIDNEPRKNGQVDIGADEWNGGFSWYKLSLDANATYVQIGQTITVTQSVVDYATQAGVPGQKVEIEVDAGSIQSITSNGDQNGEITSVTTGYGYTGTDGKVVVKVTRSDMGRVNVTSKTALSSRGAVAEKSLNVWFYDLNSPADVVFVIDRSGSMCDPTDHLATESVKRVVQEIYSVNHNTRFGVVTWDDGTPDIRSVSLFTGSTALSDFYDWFTDTNSSARGGTSAQVFALDTAVADLQTYSPSTNRRFVVFVTDSNMEGAATTDSETREEAKKRIVAQLDALTKDNGGGVFLSLWESPNTPDADSLLTYFSQNFTGDSSYPYPSLAANGGFDSIDWSNASAETRYKFDLLKNRILYGL